MAVNVTVTRRTTERTAPVAVSHSRMADLGLLVLRASVGAIMFAHGAQKLLGAFGGPGLAGVVEHMGNLGYLVAIGEFFGGIALIVGLFSRFSAFWLTVIMLGAIVQVHGKNGFFSQNGGYEYNLALIGMLVPIVLAGPGAFALVRHLPFGLSRKLRPALPYIE
jgi:putative oxidoreductase